MIASRIDALTEVVGEAGWYVEHDDVNGWVEALRRMRDEPSSRAELSAAGIERAAADALLDARRDLDSGRSLDIMYGYRHKFVLAQIIETPTHQVHP